jgi:hypothetical protein
MGGGGVRLILLSDACILIDLAYVDSIDLLPRLGQCEVLDLVLQECEHPSQPDLVQRVKDSGITVIEVTTALITEAKAMHSGGLSLNDRLTLCHARCHQHVVLVGDRLLRKRCASEGIEYRGAFWLVEEAHRLSLVAPQELCRWLTVWPKVGRRLPAEELKRVQQLLNCPTR